MSATTSSDAMLSRELVGSSSKRQAAPVWNAAASTTRWRMPLERVRIGLWSNPATPQRCSTRATVDAWGQMARTARMRPRTVIQGHRPGSSLLAYAMRPRYRATSQMSMPAMWAVPCTRPTGSAHRARNRVVLPVPFGARKTQTPPGSSEISASTACVPADASQEQVKFLLAGE